MAKDLLARIHKSSRQCLWINWCSRPLRVRQIVQNRTSEVVRISHHVKYIWIGWEIALFLSAHSNAHVISPRLRMLLWRWINVNTAYCKHPCDSLQPFRTLWMFILGSSVHKDLETSISKACSAICCSKLAQNPLQKESPCIRKIPESMLNHFSIREALIYFPSPIQNAAQVF